MFSQRSEPPQGKPGFVRFPDTSDSDSFRVVAEPPTDYLGRFERDKYSTKTTPFAMFRGKVTQRLHLGDMPAWPSRTGVSCLPVENLRGVIDDPLTAGHEAKIDFESLAGFARALAMDPFGNRIELMQVMAPTPRDLR